MGIVRKFRAIIGSGLAGKPSDRKSAPCQLPYETLRKRWNTVPTKCMEFESIAKLILKPEYLELIRHSKVGGRWLQLVYPKCRWIRYGSPTFSTFDELTNGVGTRWAEWYDVPKLLSMFAPAKFDVLFYQEFHNSDFTWFNLPYRDMPNSVRP